MAQIYQLFQAQKKLYGCAGLKEEDFVLSDEM